MWRSRTLAIFTAPICQLHSRRTERAITKALFRYNLSTTSSPPAKRNPNWEMQKQTGLMGPRRGSFERSLKGKDRKGNRGRYNHSPESVRITHRWAAGKHGQGERRPSDRNPFCSAVRMTNSKCKKLPIQGLELSLWTVNILGWPLCTATLFPHPTTKAAEYLDQVSYFNSSNIY